MKRVALFVGVDRYGDESIQDLRCAVNDATDLAGFFRHRAGFERAEAMANPRNRDEVLRRVESLTKGLGAGDEFVFFFAGHGFTVKNNHVLVCAEDQYEAVAHEWAGLPLELLKWATRGAYDRVFLLDACRTDLLAGHRGAASGMASGTRDLILGTAGVGSGGEEGRLTVFCSCDEGQTAGEIAGKNHGIFSLAMLELLEEGVRAGWRVEVSDDFQERVGERMRKLATDARLPCGQRPQKMGPRLTLVEGRDGGGSAEAVPGEVCETCGRYRPLTELFKCRECGKWHCAEHQDSETWLCSGCAGEQRREEEKREAGEDGGKRAESEEGGRAIRRIDLGYGVAVEMVSCPEIATGFWMGRMPVTQEQWQRVMGTNPSRAKDRPTHPVTQVSWNACQRFVERLNGMETARESGLEFRLPREDEWQTACRAGAPKTEQYCRLADGTQITESTLGRVAWFGEGKKKGGTHPVGEKEPNAWGLYDMFGNVDEWVHAEAMRSRPHQAICGGNDMGCACGADWHARLDAATAKGTIGLRLAAFEREGDAAEVERVRQGAWNGEVEAELELGRRFEEGRGMEWDGEEALKWVVRAAEAGLAAAQVAYGERWREGRGVKANAAKAAAWYRKAAVQKDAEGQYRLGMCYLQGEGVQQNDAQAGNWLKKAAAQGHEAAVEAFRGIEGRLEAIKREKEEKRKREAEEQKAREAKRRMEEEEEKRAREAEERKQAVEARRAEMDEWQHELARAKAERAAVFERFRRCLAAGDEKAALEALREIAALRQRTIEVQRDLAGWKSECLEEGYLAGAEAAERECQAWKEVEQQLVRDVNDAASDFEEALRMVKQGHLDTKVRIGGRVVQVHVTGARAAPESGGGKEEKKGWFARLFGRGRMVECPICGGKNEPTRTFRCPKCGRDGLCSGHRDGRTGWCEECVRKAAAPSGDEGIESAAMSEKRKWLNAYLERMQETMGILGLSSVIVDHITAWDRKAQFWEMGGCRGPEPELTDIMKTCLKEGRKIVEGLG